MMIDRYGGCHSTSESSAVQWFETAVAAVAAHRPVGSALQSALGLDPGLVSAHALLGLANVILGRTETHAVAADYRSAALRALEERDGGSPSERALVRAVDLAATGHLSAAADTLEKHLEICPTDFLAVKIAHSLRFMCGQPAEMLALTRRVLPHWTPQNGGYGFVVGCHAFALEENGYYREAESRGREAYSHEAADAWGLHAVSHVMEMSNRTTEGIEWLTTSRKDWTLCNNFAYHIGWHLALFHLERGEVAMVLDLYDQDVRATPTDDFRDMANAASLLWRLEQEGVDVGPRWDALYDIASRRREDTTYIFGSLHYLLVLLAKGDKRGASELMGALRERAATTGDQADIAARVGLPLAEVLAAAGDAPAMRYDLANLGVQLQSLGGSHAQRDVFLRSLLVAASRKGDAQDVIALSRVRHTLRSSDRFIRMIDRRCGLASLVRPPARSPGEFAL